ncbi:UvrD-helicase domain-containing protein [Thiobacillus denitrificans]|uniref:UvrD-helicase domain-containing protein n=1 Tax=Thiobacillus denitrificans TaxID=36861 RepID=UPI000362829F|nr:UvrD-helicase domain-containing protein [Thiobacillus denitrificans]
MSDPGAIDDNTIDAGVEEEIHACLDLAQPRSFFLYAGAGSGKTRSLVNALKKVQTDSRKQLLLAGRGVAVITYTNNACDEIKQRLDFDPLVKVSTIHSLAWSLIGGYHGDIREWLRENIKQKLVELEAAASKGRPGTKTAEDRQRSIASGQRRLARLESIKRFVYSPTGNNRTRDSLNHSEVIGIAADFLKEKPLLQNTLVSKYPILFIDESQDTNKNLMDAFLAVQQAQKDRFCLGLFGDTMQRIYADGKVGLEKAIPADWATPVKKLNYRCPQRVIQLINRVRSAADGQMQQGHKDSAQGFVRLFILPSNMAVVAEVEEPFATKMAEVTGDAGWSKGEFKTLILEHHMAARRLGFDAMFAPLYAVERLKTSLLDGSLSSLRLFSEEVLPVVEAYRSDNSFRVAEIARKYSPLLRPEALFAAGSNQLIQLQKTKAAVAEVAKLWDNDAHPSFQQVLDTLAATKLFVIPDALTIFVSQEDADATKDKLAEDKAIDDQEEDELSEVDIELEGWRKFLATPFDQIKAYADYVAGTSPFGTHQGVKGLEFPRVKVVVSDEEARGFMFSYEKLFGAKAKSAADLKNEEAGDETTIDRTRRLFYVTCSRAMESLAIVAYSEQPDAIREMVVGEGWFTADEVEVLKN